MARFRSSPPLSSESKLEGGQLDNERRFRASLEQELNRLRQKINELEAWRTAHEPGDDPHPQYLLPEELPQSHVQYWSSKRTGAHYSRLASVEGPETSITKVITGADQLVARFASVPATENSLYAQLETRVTIAIAGEPQGTTVYVKAVRKRATGTTRELGVSDPPIRLKDTRANYVFVLPMPDPLSILVDDVTFIEVYATKEAGGTSRIVTLHVDNAISFDTTFLPLPAFPAAACGAIECRRNSAFSDIDSTWRKLTIMTVEPLPSNLFEVDTANRRFRFQVPGIYRISLGGVMQHNEEDDGRELLLRLYDETSRIARNHSTYPTGRNAPGTLISDSQLFNVEIPVIGNWYSLQARSSDTYTDVVFEELNLSVNSVLVKV